MENILPTSTTLLSTTSSLWPSRSTTAMHTTPLQATPSMIPPGGSSYFAITFSTAILLFITLVSTTVIIVLGCVLHYKSKKLRKIERERNTTNDLNTSEPIYEEISDETRLRQDAAYTMATTNSLEYESIRSIPPERRLPPEISLPLYDEAYCTSDRERPKKLLEVENEQSVQEFTSNSAYNLLTGQ